MDYSNYSKDELINEILNLSNRLEKYELDHKNRLKAKELLKEKSDDRSLNANSKIDNVEISKLIEELNIHQIELELQNDELININEQIAKERELYLDLYNQAPIPYLTLNRNGNIIKLNNSASELLGIETHKLNYNSFFPFIHTDSKFKFSLHFKNVLDKNDTEWIEIMLTNSNGSTIYCQLQTVSYFDHNYNDKLCRLTVTDITRQKKELLESNKKFEIIFSSINDAVFIHPFNDLPDQLFSEVNQSAIEKYGYTREEFMKMTPFDITDPESVNEDKARKIHKNIKEKRNIVFEAVHITKDGNKIPVEINTSVINYSDNEYVLSIARDITERKKITNKMEKLNQRIESSMLAGNMAWWEMELPSGKTTFNENKTKLLGYDAKDFNVYQDFMKYIHPEDYENTMQVMRDHIQGKKKFYETEYRIKSKSGDYKWFYDIGKLFSTDNENMEFAGIVLDVTDKKIAEIKLKELNKSKDKLFSMIAHDLRSPFTGFLGLSELLSSESDTISKSELKRISTNLNKSANAVFNLINDLLLWARSQSGSIPVHKENLDLYELIYNNMYLLSKTADMKNITIETNCEPGKIVNVDRNMIMTVIRNLLDNAIKFSEKNSNIIIDCFENESHLTVTVKDFGMGISNERLSNLFKLGESISSRGTSGEKGSGLGLNICKEFVEKNEGEIWAESEPEKGSTFFFTVPKEKK